MRLPTASLFLIVAVLLGGMQAASAQSPTSYHWIRKILWGLDGRTNVLLFHELSTV
jgi:hypothetical protein